MDKIFDFVSLGGGLGGLAAAIAATSRGMNALIVEKSPMVGGVSGVSGGQCWVPGNHLAQAAGIDDSVQAGLDYILWAGGGLAHEPLARNLFARAPAVIRFFEDYAGVEWELVPHYPDGFAGHPNAVSATTFGRTLGVREMPGEALGAWRARTRNYQDASSVGEQLFGARGDQRAQLAERARLDMRTRGGALIGNLLRSAMKLGITIWTDCSVHDLIVSDGRVVGANVEKDGRMERIEAKGGILLAMSGYDSNAALLKMYNPSPSVSTVAPPSVTGDHLRLAGMLGAQVAAPFRPLQVMLAADVPVERDWSGTLGYPLQDSPVFTTYPHAIIVNDKGKRFHDESFSQSQGASLATIDPCEPRRLANSPCWAVWDSQHVDRYLDGQPPTQEGVVQAQTLQDLAKALGIDPLGLTDQIAYFNADAASGVDTQFNRGSLEASREKGDRSDETNPNLGTIARAPFYGVKLAIRTIGLAAAGLVTDTASRVLDWRGNPVPGLYAAGNSVAYLDLGMGYQSGCGNTRGLVHGFQAAMDAAEHLTRASARS